MAVSSELVKQLRESTGAGMMDCKKALDASGGNLEQAHAWLLERGLSSAAKKASRETNDGVVELYQHSGGRLGVMVEVNCETDFVARTPDFKTLAHDVAIQIASTGPLFVRREDIPSTVLAAQTASIREELGTQGTSATDIDAEVATRIEAWIKDSVLLEQSFVKDDSVKISDMIKAAIAKMGENVIIRRFSRFQLGGD